MVLHCTVLLLESYIYIVCWHFLDFQSIHKMSEPSRNSRNYDNVYLKFGFSCIGPIDVPRPQCVVCKEDPANSGGIRRPSIKVWCFKLLEFFSTKPKKSKTHKKIVETFSTSNGKATKASHHTATHTHTAKAGKPHKIGKTLLLPSAKDMCSMMTGEAAVAKLSGIPLSDDTVQRHISDMA